MTALLCFLKEKVVVGRFLKHCIIFNNVKTSLACLVEALFLVSVFAVIINKHFSALFLFELLPPPAPSICSTL